MATPDPAPPAQPAAAPAVISLAGVSKRFVIRKDKSLKERVVNFGRVATSHREDFWALRDVDARDRRPAPPSA